jgi:hypothetical protein
MKFRVLYNPEVYDDLKEALDWYENSVKVEAVFNTWRNPVQWAVRNKS